MKKLLNTLYVTSEGAWLGKDGRNIVVRIDGAERGRVPAHLLGQIVCFGQVALSPQLMLFCAEEGVSIVYLGAYGRFLARIEGPQSGNVLLRRAQHEATASAARALPVARAMVAAKLANQRAVLSRTLRDHGENMPPAAREAIEQTRALLAHAARRALHAGDLDELRGLEGDAGAAWWRCFPHLLRNPDFTFGGRNRRPPRDPVNALLSFLYVFLASDCRAAAETHGLDPQMGFLHRDRPGRMSLALDLMEEFRAPLADRLCLSLVNRRQLSPRDFRFEETGTVLLSDEGRATVLKAWQERKRDTIRHDFVGETVPVGLLMSVQAQLLARHLRKDLDGYPAFIWR